MNKRSLRILEYNKIIDMLIPYAGSPMGQTLCKRLKPSTDHAQILRLQEETRDALSRLYKQGSISFSGVTDIGMSLKRLEVGATLSPAELLDIARLLDNTLSVRQYGISEEEDHEPDCLDSRFLDLMPLEHLSRDIRRCILSADEIADDASSALKPQEKCLYHGNLQQLYGKFTMGCGKRTSGHVEGKSRRTWIWTAQYPQDGGEICRRYRHCIKGWRILSLYYANVRVEYL